MKTQRQFLTFSFLLAFLLQPVHADDAEDAAKEELKKQEAFRAGFSSIVNDLNDQNFDSFVAAINQQDMVDRIYGLRLIDMGVKRQFSQNLVNSFPSMVKSGVGLVPAGIVPVRNVPENGAGYVLLGIESRGDLGRAVIRVDLKNQQFNYQEFDLRLGKRNAIIIVDWTDYLSGIDYSESIGRHLVLTTPSKSALRKLIDIQNVSERELYLFGELMKAARDGNLTKYEELRNRLQPRLQRQRIVVEMGVHAAKARRKRREMVAALGIMAEYFPEEPLYSLMLLDHLLPQKKYEEGMAALQRLAEKLEVEDAAMEARLSAISLVMGNDEDADRYADQAITREPGLELGWLSAFSARASLSDFAGTVDAAATLRADFDRDLDPETLGKNPAFAQLLASSEYQRWRESLE